MIWITFKYAFQNCKRINKASINRISECYKCATEQKHDWLDLKSWIKPHLKTVISPTSKLHNTRLLVKGEIFDIYFTGGFINSWRLPLYKTVVPQCCLRCKGHLEIPISAEIDIYLRHRFGLVNSIIIYLRFKIDVVRGR